VAEDSDNLVASRLQMLTALLEPVMILVLGGLVGFVVIAIILPIFEMSSLVS
jgi:general secretion pathway protein F